MRASMEMGLSERTVTVDRQKLLETLRANRKKHQHEYQESVLGYKKMATDRLKKLQMKAKAELIANFARVEEKIEKFDPEDEDGILSDVVTLISSMSFSLKVPKDYTSAYDVAIQMAEWEVNENVELTQGQFQCFVMDDWEWQKEFQYLNKTYSNVP